MENIYRMGLHETIEVSSSCIRYLVTRVAGGWLYNHIRLDSGAMTIAFVPFNNEFMETE